MNHMKMQKSVIYGRKNLKINIWKIKHILKFKIIVIIQGNIADFYNHLNMEDITDADYVHAKRVCKDFEIKNRGEYHDLYFQSDRLLLADVFENFRIICLKIYKLDPAKYFQLLD